MPVPTFMVEDTPDAREARAQYRAEGWDGRCRLWFGQRCKKGKKCKRKGDGFVSPVTEPSPAMRPQGYAPEQRQMETCPERSPAWVAGMLQRWSDYDRTGSLPEDGGAGAQCNRTMESIAVLDSEVGLIRLAHQEERLKAMRDRDG